MDWSPGTSSPGRSETAKASVTPRALPSSGRAPSKTASSRPGEVPVRRARRVRASLLHPAPSRGAGAGRTSDVRWRACSTSSRRITPGICVRGLAGRQSRPARARSPHSAAALTLVVGILLVLLARALRRRKRRAWRATVFLLAASTVSHVVKGHDVAQSVIPFVLLLVARALPPRLLRQG